MASIDCRCVAGRRARDGRHGRSPRQAILSGYSQGDAQALDSAYRAELLFKPIEAGVAESGVYTYVIGFGTGASTNRLNWIAWGGSGLRGEEIARHAVAAVLADDDRPPLARLQILRQHEQAPREQIGMNVEPPSRSSRTQARRVTVKVTGRNGVYPVVAGDEPLEAIVVLGDETDAVVGACGESAFVAADCAFNRRATALNCRQ